MNANRLHAKSTRNANVCISALEHDFELAHRHTGHLLRVRDEDRTEASKLVAASPNNVGWFFDEASEGNS